MRKLYEWIDRAWQWIAKRVFVRFDFDLPTEQLSHQLAKGRLVLSLTHGGIIEWLILSSWCRSQGFGAVLVCNRKSILLLSKPLYFLQVIFRRKHFSDLFLSAEPGPRLMFCPTSERKQPFKPTPVEKLLGSIVTVVGSQGSPWVVLPVFMIWKRHVRGAARNPTEYLLGLGSNPNLLGKIWYLWRQRKDSIVRALPMFSFLDMMNEHAARSKKDTDSLGEIVEEGEGIRIAKSIRRKILVLVGQEMRVILGPRYLSPHLVKETLLKDTDIQKEVEEIAQREKVDLKKVMLRAYRNFSEIVSHYQYRTIEILYALLNWLFTKVFDGLYEREDELRRVRELMKAKPVVFVSCHRSHLDYLVIPYVLFLHDMVTPHIVAGINLSFWPVGNILRSGGAFFIRRSFRGDALYNLCLRKYVEYLLKNRFNIKFFIEGTRSRSGKMLTPAYGLLKMVMDTVFRGVCEDIALIPVAICYEEVPEEGAYMKELVGEQKKKEDAGALLRSRSIIKRKFGKVYVRFGPNISVKEIAEHFTKATSDERLQKTAFQLCKRINDVSPITPKAIVSCVLLASRVPAQSLEEILRLSWHLGELVKWSGLPLSIDLGEGFKRTIEQTLRALQKNGVVGVSEEEVPRLYYCQENRRRAQNFYKNNAIHAFIVPSMCLISVFYVLKSSPVHEKGQALEQAFRRNVLYLKNLLKFEFFFSPTEEFNTDLNKILGLYFKGQPLSEVSISTVLSSLERSFSKWDDISLLMRLLGDLLEAYRTCLNVLMENGGREYEKKILVQKIVKYAEDLSSRGDLSFPESISIQTYSNAVSFFENQKWIRSLGEKGKIYVERTGPGHEAMSLVLTQMLDLLEDNLPKQHGFLTKLTPTFAPVVPG